MGFAGGAAGVAVGWAIGRAIQFVTELYLRRQGIAVIILVGAVVVDSRSDRVFRSGQPCSGMYPATRAAKLDPWKHCDTNR